MSGKKPWERPWSMEEIIENSDKWSLAGDVALLNTLKSFADNLISKTTEINSNLQNLTRNLDETSLKLNIAENEFQSLRNTQFIESRVYEDDESLPQIEEVKKNEDKNEADLTDEIRLAALKGLAVLNEYFDKVEVSVSDSEDDDIDLPNYILRPKDLYIQRPLPYIIGTDEWHKSRHVGLEDSSSDSETEKASDKFSESDSEGDLAVIQDRSNIKGTSDTSSEFDYSQKAKKSDIFNSSENSSENSVPAAPTSNNNFAEELAAKLGNVITDLEPEINKKPIQKTPKTNYDNIFFDEPPPLDEPKGLFSGRGGLFDDDDDNQSLRKGGLFDGGDISDEDDIFARKPPQISKPGLLSGAPPSVTQPNLLAEEPPTLDVHKKPVGGVSILGGGGLFDKKLLKRRVSSEDEEEEKTKEEKQKIDLFGDDTIFDSPPKRTEEKPEGTKVKKINLFDSDEEAEETPGGSHNEKSEPPKPKKISLFDDDDDLFKDDLFSATSTKTSFTSGLFDDISGEDFFSTQKTKSSDLFDDLVKIPNERSVNIDTNRENKPSALNLVENEKPLPKPRLHLFDSPPPETDDLFKDDLFSKSTPTHSEPMKNETIFIPKSRDALFEEPTPPDVALFDPSPVPVDDWEAKSEPTSDNDDFNDFPKSEAPKPSLFSEEPPSLPETVRKPKPGKLKHNLKINVGALLPGSTRPKFNDKTNTSDDLVTVAPSVTLPVDETDRVEVLHSVTKDRVRVPLNRRPSTRRGRKAALQVNSDFKLEQEEKEIGENEKPEKSNEKKTLFEEAINENSLFRETKKTDESEDLFGKQLHSQNDSFPKKLSENDLFTDVNQFKADNIFGESPNHDDLFEGENLFRKPPKDESLTEVDVNKPQTENLFGESPQFETNTDLFTETAKNVPKAENLVEKNSQTTDSLFPQLSGSHNNLFGNSNIGEIPKKATALFQDSPKSATEDEDLFSKVSKSDYRPQDKKIGNQSKSSIFDDDDDDSDDLFSPKKTIQQPKKKKSLFDDDNDDDDDIFKSAKPNKTETKIATEKKIPKMSSVKKLENTKPDDDPLSALLK